MTNQDLEKKLTHRLDQLEAKVSKQSLDTVEAARASFLTFMEKNIVPTLGTLAEATGSPSEVGAKSISQSAKEDLSRALAKTLGLVCVI